MVASHTSSIAQSIGYQLRRAKAGSDDVELILALYVNGKLASETRIALLSGNDSVQVLIRCIAHLERLGAYPVADATERVRAA